MPWVRSLEWSDSGRRIGVYSNKSEQLRVSSEGGKVGQGLGADSRKTKNLDKDDDEGSGIFVSDLCRDLCGSVRF